MIDRTKMRTRSRSASAKKKKPVLSSNIMKQTKIVAPGGKKWIGTKKPQSAKPSAQEWNSQINATSKYFDPSIDPKEQRI